MDMSFPYVQQIFKLDRTRSNLDGSNPSAETVFGITSASASRLNADQLLQGIRGHWCIENSDHYVKDVTLGEDACRVRHPGSAQILSVFRNLTLNVLRVLEFTNIAEGVRNFAFGPKTLALRTLGIK